MKGKDKGSSKGLDGRGYSGPKDSHYTAAVEGTAHTSGSPGGKGESSSGTWSEPTGPNPGHAGKKK